VPDWIPEMADVSHTAELALQRLEQATLWLGLALVVSAAVWMIAKAIAQARATRGTLCNVESEVVSPDVLQEGWQATVQIPAPSGFLCLPARVGVMSRRWMALDLHGSAPPTTLKAGTPAIVMVTGETAAFRFHTGLRQGRQSNTEGALLVERPQWLEKIQRRAYFRVPVALPAVLSLPDGETFHVYQGTLSDLSAGGFRMAIAIPLEAGLHVRLRVADEALSGFSFDARVICVNASPFGKGGRCAVQCEFLYVTEELRDRLVAYCFDLQRAARKERQRIN
jgi:c-di-GMP-binding flagellar brake protein YcgR